MTDEELGRFLREPPVTLGGRSARKFSLRWKGEQGQSGTFEIHPAARISQLPGLVEEAFQRATRESDAFRLPRYWELVLFLRDVD
jgi:hypothetical protein